MTNAKVPTSTGRAACFGFAVLYVAACLVTSPVCGQVGGSPLGFDPPQVRSAVLPTRALGGGVPTPPPVDRPFTAFPHSRRSQPSVFTPPIAHPSYLTDAYQSALAPQRAAVGPYVSERFVSPEQAPPLVPEDRLTEPAWGSDVFQPVTPYKETFFQRLQYSGTLIGRGDAFDFGLTESKLLATFVLPMPTKNQPLLITPGYNERYFSGPLAPDLPERVIDAYVEFMWLPKLNDRWTGIVSIKPGVYGDMEDGDDDSFRVTGKALAKWDWVPSRWQLIFGLLYLGRNDIAVMPAGGLVWTPNEWTRWDFMFPTPKAAWRIGGQSGVFEDWVYLAGEFGGDQWSVTRAGGQDTIIMRDFRLMTGLHRKWNGGRGIQFEGGIVTGRVIEFESATPDYESDPAGMVRVILTR